MNRNIFNSSAIEMELRNVKDLKKQHKKAKSLWNKQQKIIEEYLKENIVKKQICINYFYFHQNIPNDSEDIISNLKEAKKLDQILSNIEIANKIYVGQLIEISLNFIIINSISLNSISKLLQQYVNKMSNFEFNFFQSKNREFWLLFIFIGVLYYILLF